jgi:4-oxalocrotonate tautomerase
MPYVNVRVTPGISTQQCRDIVAGVTETLVRVLDKKPEHTHVVIDEVDESRWGFAGKLVSELEPGS